MMGLLYHKSLFVCFPLFNFFSHLVHPNWLKERSILSICFSVFGDCVNQFGSLCLYPIAESSILLSQIAILYD